MVKITNELLSRFNGRLLSPGIILLQPMVKSFFTSNSLLFLDETTLVLETGFQFGSGQLRTVRDLFNPDLILFSHYHIDHIFGCYLFSECPKLIHRSDQPAFISFEEFLTFCFGGSMPNTDELNNWNEHFSTFLELESLSGWDDLGLDNHQVIESNDTLNLGEMTLEIIHLPGHTPGHCCFYEPTSQVLFIGDFDILSKFGPWYGWRNTNLSLFRSSTETLKHFVENNEITTIVPSHSRPLQKQKCLDRLIVFNKVFDKRDEQILKFIANQKDGTTISEIADQSFIYQGKKSDPPYVWEFFERIHIEKHVEELLADGRIKKEEDQIFIN
ncbi:MAG: MBL fold metallo-hydrolase [Candidatus Hermodarchaeota archaeon]